MSSYDLNDYSDTESDGDNDVLATLLVKERKAAGRRIADRDKKQAIRLKGLQSSKTGKKSRKVPIYQESWEERVMKMSPEEWRTVDRKMVNQLDSVRNQLKSMQNEFGVGYILNVICPNKKEVTFYTNVDGSLMNRMGLGEEFTKTTDCGKLLESQWAKFGRKFQRNRLSKVYLSFLLFN